MKHRLPIVLLAAAGLQLLAQPVSAQRIDSPYRFLDYGQFLGAYGSYVSASEGRIGLGPQPAAGMGINWALRVSGPFSIGADVGYLPTTRTVRDTVFEADNSTFRSIGEADVSLLTVMGNLRFSLTGPRTWNSLQPHVVLGAGVALDLAGSSAAEADLDSTERFDFGTSFAGQFGAGVDWFPTSRLSLRVDARNLLWKLKVPDAFRLTESGRTLAESDWEQNLAFTAGLSIHF